MKNGDNLKVTKICFIIGLGLVYVLVTSVVFYGLFKVIDLNCKIASDAIVEKITESFISKTDVKDVPLVTDYRSLFGYIGLLSSWLLFSGGMIFLAAYYVKASFKFASKRIDNSHELELMDKKFELEKKWKKED